MGCSNKTNIYTITEKSSDLTLFDCRWVPCSTRFVVAGTHTKGHGILNVYTISETEELKHSGKNSRSVSDRTIEIKIRLEFGWCQIWIFLFSATIERKRHPFKCITFGATQLSERNPATGDFDGNINVWDIENKIPGKSFNKYFVFRK